MVVVSVVVSVVVVVAAVVIVEGDFVVLASEHFDVSRLLGLGLSQTLLTLQHVNRKGPFNLRLKF